MSEFQLSICVPTYERAELLARACGRIVEQVVAEGLEDRVELCVSDNASTDGTEREVAAFAHSGVAVSYRRQRRNLGFARNLDSVVRMARGRYVMLAGDDDMLLPGALRAAYEVSLRDSDIVIFNTLSGSGCKPQLAAEIDFEALPVIASPETANEALGVFHLSFIGNLMFKKEVYERHYQPSFSQSAYPHTCVLLSALRESSAVFVNIATFEVDDSCRNMNQPLLTSVDMSRVQTQCVLSSRAPFRVVSGTYLKLIKSIPRAVLNEKSDAGKPRSTNPYADLSLKNLMDCYSCSRLCQLIAALLWCISKVTPARILKFALR